MHKRSVLAFDPAAETVVSDTGWALLEYDDDTAPRLVDSGVISGGYQGFSDWMDDSRMAFHNGTVVCEQFRLYRAAADPSPLLIEGVIRYMWPKTVLQRANEKEIASKTRLKKLGVWSSEGHHADAGSAVQHAYAYLLRQRHEPTIRLFSPPRPTPPQ